MDPVSVRELSQNLSVYLRRVENGETLSITSRGRPVAILTPPPEAGHPLGDPIAAARVIPARRRLGDLPPPLALRPDDQPLSETLDDLREERLP
jgi:prevent-host-death family protein